MVRAPTPAELLAAWELGRSQTPVRRARILLALADPAAAADAATCTIGQRDQTLLGLHEQLFGSRLNATTACPHCRQEIELEFPVAGLRESALSAAGNAYELVTAGYDLRFRLPSCRDLETLDDAAAGSDRRRLLLRQCVLQARQGETETNAAELPEVVTAGLLRRMAELDPASQVSLALRCPQCDRAWQAPFDIVAYLWDELHTWTSRLLRDVHELAQAYGWSESEILALSPWRRQAYLDLIQE